MAPRIFSVARTFILYMVALCLGLGGTYYWFHQQFFAPADISRTEALPFVVERGWTLRRIADELQAKGIVRSWWSIYLLAKMKGEKVIENNKSKIQPGEYALAYNLTPNQILTRFINQEILYHEVQIIEGKTVRDATKAMVATGLVTEAEVLSLLNSQQLFLRFGIPASTFEGYFYPDTYKFTRPENAELMISRFVQETNKRFTPDVLDRIQELDLTKHQVLTLASIIEKETGNPAERNLISSVFHNRLRLGMPLQSDPTVIYGIPDFDGNLTKAHLVAPSAYNTYINKGLPPTPIANPGAASIEAALHPADTDYLYFVAKGDGTSHFSATYDEHRKAVRQYQLERSQPQPAS